MSNDFKKAMEGVKPLVQDKVLLRKSFSKPHSNHSIKKHHSQLEDLNENILTSEEKLFFRRSGLQHRQLQKLKQGKFTLEASLDLHRMTIPHARDAVEDFIQSAHKNNLRYILIVHGKGRSQQSLPVLKNQVNHWLEQLDAVLAFCSALPKDGGTGAVYVLLKSGVKYASTHR